MLENAILMVMVMMFEAGDWWGWHGIGVLFGRQIERADGRMSGIPLCDGFACPPMSGDVESLVTVIVWKLLIRSRRAV